MVSCYRARGGVGGSALASSVAASVAAVDAAAGPCLHPRSPSSGLLATPAGGPHPGGGAAAATPTPCPWLATRTGRRQPPHPAERAWEARRPAREVCPRRLQWQGEARPRARFIPRPRHHRPLFLPLPALPPAARAYIGASVYAVSRAVPPHAAPPRAAAAPQQSQTHPLSGRTPPAARVAAPCAPWLQRLPRARVGGRAGRPRPARTPLARAVPRRPHPTPPRPRLAPPPPLRPHARA